MLSTHYSAGPTNRPILFSGPMVRAILAGTKTQTRRMACKGMIPPQYVTAVQYEPARWRLFDAETPHSSCNQYTLPLCPYGQPGDRLSAECEALRADAERYRALRDGKCADWAICEWSYEDEAYFADSRPASVVDAAITAAMGGKEAQHAD